MSCTSKAGDEELKSFLQHLVGGGSPTSAVVIGSFECPVHGIHVESVVCSKPLPSTREHVRKVIDHMRQYADSLEGYYFKDNPAEPVTQTHGANN